MKGLKKHFFIKITIGFLLLLLSLVVGVYLVSFLLGPPDLAPQQNTVLYSEAGEVIGEENANGIDDWTALDEMPDTLTQSTLLAEDQHFYQHHGFDMKRILGALWTDLKTMSLKQGASTLTQQYARNLYLSFEKSWTRKLQEAFYTIRLEMFYDKDEILEGYLNTIYYGHGAYGIASASEHYFDKPVTELSVAETTMLAAIPKGPTYYSPFSNPENAEKRQNWILRLLRDHQVINEKEFQQADQEKLEFNDPDEKKQDKQAPYFADAALQEAASLLDLDQEQVRAGGYQIYTSLDSKQQKQLKKNKDAVFEEDSDMEIGAIAMDPDDGGIRALLGGRNYQDSSFNRAIKSNRMPGSAFKPFLYYGALENGYTPATMLMSKPTTFKLEDGQEYKPNNFNGYYADKPITLAQALALSDNIYAVKTGLFLGVDNLIDTARDVGITSKLPEVPSLTLGTAATSVEDMVNGYGVFANNGQETSAHTVEKIADRKGKVLFERDDDQGKQVLDEKQTFILTQMLTGMFDRSLDGYMSVTGSTIADQLSRTYAGKSGSTDSDSWMIGYSPDLVTGIWTGYDDNRTIEKVKEKAYAKEVWARFMEDAHKKVPRHGFAAPADIVKVAIDPETGKRATRYCEHSRDMYFEKGTEPTEYCNEHLPEGKKDRTEEKQDEKDKKGPLKKLFDKLF